MLEKVRPKAERCAAELRDLLGGPADVYLAAVQGVEQWSERGRSQHCCSGSGAIAVAHIGSAVRMLRLLGRRLWMLAARFAGRRLCGVGMSADYVARLQLACVQQGRGGVRDEGFAAICRCRVRMGRGRLGAQAVVGITAEVVSLVQTGLVKVWWERLRLWAWRKEHRVGK